MPKLRGEGGWGRQYPLAAFWRLLPPSKHLFALSLICWSIGSGQEFVLGPASPKDSPTPSHTYSSLHPRPATKMKRTQGSHLRGHLSTPSSLSLPLSSPILAHYFCWLPSYSTPWCATPHPHH